MVRSIHIAILGVLSLLGCTEPHRVSGALSLPTGDLPPRGQVAVVWGKDAEVFGLGRSGDDAFWVSFHDAPPDRYRDEGLAVGRLVLVPQATRLHVGAPVPASATVLGRSTSVVVLHRDGDVPAWASDVPHGWSCGRVRGERIAPVACDRMRLPLTAETQAPVADGLSAVTRVSEGR